MKSLIKIKMNLWVFFKLNTIYLIQLIYLVLLLVGDTEENEVNNMSKLMENLEK